MAILSLFTGDAVSHLSSTSSSGANFKSEIVCQNKVHIKVEMRKKMLFSSDSHLCHTPILHIIDDSRMHSTVSFCWVDLVVLHPGKHHFDSCPL
mmetsp:Transcript_48406/g.113324  ORF Transcript_48406/g.113324 Transcript_48406/m.113324 type:complete len:94 (+) Transcript_48406:446-727(+)